jgi:enoyl-CoA hydratase/carnithine racemase
MYGKIITNLNEQVLEIILNNPAKLNCMGFQMLNELKDALEFASKEESVRVVVFKGAGERAFSTGADLKEFQTLPAEKANEWIEFGNQVFNTIEDFKKPTIAFINGYAMGGGLELALACDFRVGTETAVFASPELRHGWLPGWGGMTRLRHLTGEVRAKEIVMLCGKITAAEALKIGLLNKIDTSENGALNNMISQLRNLDPKLFELAKSSLADTQRTTRGVDVQFDILAMKYSTAR